MYRSSTRNKQLKQKEIELAIRSKKEDGFEIKILENKGRCVFSTKKFFKGDFVCEYSGELIDYSEAIQREQKYAENNHNHCYMYFFKHKSKRYCIDATVETQRVGRLYKEIENRRL